MSTSILIAFLGAFLFALTGRIMAHPFSVDSVDAGELEALLNSGDYEIDGDQMYIPPCAWKRSGFWSSHPSDYSPMRRPSGGQQGSGRGTKKSDLSPYHPIPRSVNIGQKNQRSHGTTMDEDLEEALAEGLRDKRQSPGSFLLMKLGRVSKPTTGNEVGRRLGRRRI